MGRIPPTARVGCRVLFMRRVPGGERQARQMSFWPKFALVRK